MHLIIFIKVVYFIFMGGGGGGGVKYVRDESPMVALGYSSWLLQFLSCRFALAVARCCASQPGARLDWSKDVLSAESKTNEEIKYGYGRADKE